MMPAFTDAYAIVEKMKKRLDKPVENYAGYMSTKALDDFSVQMVEYRIKHNLNQTQLARELGISQPMVSKYEEGDNNISVKRLCEICEKIGVRVSVTYESNDASQDRRVQDEESVRDYSNDAEFTAA